MAGTGLALASANAANPTTTTGTSTLQSNGNVFVQLTGDWSWDAIDTGGNGTTSPQLKCAQRWGVGFAVDWADPSQAPWSTPGLDTISKNGITFQADPVYSDVVNNLCKNTAADGAPQGNSAGNQWVATHTYPSVKDVPSIICVNVYDMHGTATQQPTGSNWIATGSGHDSDNSIETNGFNPALGGNCFKTPPIVNPNPPTMTVDKTNNADQTTTANNTPNFQKTETAKVVGEDVLFHVVVTNTTTDPLTIDSVSDSYGSNTITPACQGTFVGATLSPAAAAGQNGGTATCDFTVHNYLNGSSSAVTDTVTVNAHDTTTSQATTGTSTSTVNPPATPTQNIVGQILACSGGMPTSTVVTGGTISVPNAGGAFTGGSNFGPQSVPSSGIYNMSATAPAGYQFVACGQNVVTLSGTPATGASQSVNVPSGGTGTGNFYVTPISTTTQTIAGTILACSPNGQPTTTQVQGGSLSVLSGNNTLFTAVNQLTATQIPAGTYTVDATVPTGYQFVSCGQSGVNIATTPTTADQSVTVPAGGAGNGVFYVAPVPSSQQQTIAGVIYVCGPNGAPTTTLVGGGTLTAALGSSDVATSNNPLTATQVPAGTYTLSATVPSGYQLVPCNIVGGPTTTYSSNGQSASQTLILPSGGAVNGVFYAQPTAVQTQTIGGSIMLCGSDGNPTNTLAGGGTLTASLNGTPVVSLANPLTPTQVASGNYNLSGVAPAGYQFVNCNQPGVSIDTPPTTANQPVTVNPGQNATGVFYVTPTPIPNIPKTQTIGGSIMLCDSNGNPTTQLVNGGVITVANSSGTTVDSVNDQLTAITVPAGTYTVTGNSPSGYTFVACGTNVTPNGNTETQTVGVAPGSTGSATFYVQPVAVQGLTLTNQPQPTESVAPATVSPATEVAGLAFTGAPSQLRWVLVAGFALLSGGLFMLWSTRPRLAQ
ncbi:MAG TPA: hypothetical protein VFP54_08490 [Acidimicrobiales bacterium]|nr:hypothetical protein [Acidimicrobiales bacterium]